MGNQIENPTRTSLFATLDRVLRGGFTQPEALATGRIAVPVRRLVALSVLLGACYGTCLGAFAIFGGASQAWLQVVASAAKVPLLFVLTLAVSFPSLYVFGALQRLPLDFRNTLRLMLLAIVVNMTVIASLGPVFAFFAASSTSYPFLVLLNVAIFALGGLLGLAVLRRATRDMFRPAAAPSTTPLPPAEGDAALPPAPARSRQAEEQARRLLGVWCVVYGIVGAQMGWLLRPFLGSPAAEFAWFRPREDNFLVGVVRAIGHLLGR